MYSYPLFFQRDGAGRGWPAIVRCTAQLRAAGVQDEHVDMVHPIEAPASVPAGVHPPPSAWKRLVAANSLLSRTWTRLSSAVKSLCSACSDQIDGAPAQLILPTEEAGRGRPAVVPLLDPSQFPSWLRRRTVGSLRGSQWLGRSGPRLEMINDWPVPETRWTKLYLNSWEHRD